MSIELCPEVGNDDYIIVCNFGGRSISGSEVIEGAFQDVPVAGSKTKPGLSRVKSFLSILVFHGFTRK